MRSYRGLKKIPVAEASLRSEHLRDAIRDMLDFTTGWCRPMSDAEKLEMIRSIGQEALNADKMRLNSSWWKLR